MENYTVKKLSDLAGVSVRTLHLYDEMELLKPSLRTEAGYRLYTEKELLRLQQILFYKELGFALQEIKSILDNPDFDLVSALEDHKSAIKQRKQHLDILLDTIDKTINKLKKGTTMKNEELYAGLPKEQAEAWRKEAIESYGREAIERSEKSLGKMTKEDLAKLKQEQVEIGTQLHSMIDQDPESTRVQEVIAKHYIIIRKFWGTHGSSDKQPEAYAGLGELYVNDERFTRLNGTPNPGYAPFMCRAMKYFAETTLKGNQE